MKAWAYAEKSDDAYRLYSLDDREPLPEGAEVRAVMMSRPDFDVHVVELPALPEDEVEGFLRYRIRALYPGHPDETAFDYQILGRNGKRLAVLFLTRRETLEAYLAVAAGKPLFLPFALFRPLCRKRGGDAAYAFWHDAWIDVMVSTREEPCQSLVLQRSADPESDVDKLRELMPLRDERREWVFLCAGSEREGLQKAAEVLEEEGYRVSIEALQDVLPGFRRSTEALFAPHKRRRLPRLGVRLQVYGAVFLLLSFLVYKRSTDRDVAYMSALLRTQAELLGRSAGSTALREEVTALEERLRGLQSRRPPDPYRVLSELHTLLPDDTRIQSFIMEKRRFQLEAVGTNPLGLMEGFKGSDLLESVKLTQIVPLEDSGRELFKITGTIRE